ncbi:WAP-type 'four-disulfide core [Trichuris suis]|nr:WAP-type 'four-disulfide core [Trichuris suis]
MTALVQLLIGLAICLLQDAETAKIGRCPPTPFAPGRARFCYSDNQCPGRKKCCLTKSGYACTTPAFYYAKPPTTTPHDTNCDEEENCPKPIPHPSNKQKPGTCPPSNFFTGKAPFCNTDSDCEGSQKCCATKAGTQCITPLTEGREVIKPGECPAVPAITGKALFCRSDEDCDGSYKCCLTSVGRTCVEPAPKPGAVVKPGSCPAVPFGPVGLANFCQSDSDCEGSLKCCVTSVGYECASPVEESLRPSKRGICPWPSSVMEKGRLCSSDGDCQGSRKCCPTKAGNACVKPVSEELAGGRGSCPPAAYVMGVPGSCRRDKDCEVGMKCCDGIDGKSCSVLVVRS